MILTDFQTRRSQIRISSKAIFSLWINPLTDDKILDQTKLEAFADDKLNVTKMIISLFDKVENIVEKRRNCLYKQFLLFSQCVQTASFPDESKSVIVWEWVNDIYCYRTHSSLITDNFYDNGYVGWQTLMIMVMLGGKLLW